MLVPDYNNPTIISEEFSDAQRYNYRCRKRGNYISQYYPNGHYWLATDGTSTTTSKYDEGDNLKYIVPCSGYIRCEADEIRSYAKEFSSINAPVGFRVRLIPVKTGERITLFTLKTTANTTTATQSTLTPVRKGDIIYYGTPFQSFAPCTNYSITFYPGIAVDALTGD